MKKTIALLLALCMVFALAACGSPSSAPAANDTPADADASSPADASADTAAEPFVINACIASEPETIDPGLISSVDGSTYTQHSSRI